MLYLNNRNYLKIGKGHLMAAREKLTEAQDVLKQVIIGQDECVELLLTSLLSGGHVLLESVPGSGKTRLAKAFAKIIEGEFSRIQFTPDVLPSDVTGIQFLNPKTQNFELRVGPVQANVLLADEINRATPRTQSSLLEVMEEHQTTIDGETVRLPSPFFVIATQNPIESNHGTFPLPEAQLDRFLMKIKLSYPTFEQEKEILRLQRENDYLNDIKPVLTTEEIVLLQQEARKIKVSDVVTDYLLRIIHQTREHKEIELGASSRAALALMRAGQARALLHRREYVTPQDIKSLAASILEHRLILSMDGAMRNEKADVVCEIIESVEVPVEMETSR
jgi:MoxR-like ATPase